LHDAAKEAAFLLYLPETDTFLEDMTRNADEYSTSMRGQELRRSLFRKFIQKRAEDPDKHWKPGHDHFPPAEK
jgi:hypothetical protein